MKWPVFVLLILCVISQEPSGAVERTVPADFGTIQQALDAAQPGDEIKVQPGQYEGPLTFKDGVTLTGAGSDKVIVRCAADAGPVLTAKGCASGRIYGIAFEQTPRKTPLPQEAQDQANPVCRTEASTLEIENCEARGSECFGFDLRGKGAPVLTSCVATKNARSGICVKGPEAAPRLVKNNCSGNQRSGIFLWEDSTAKLEENICKDNTYCGIYTLGPKCALTLLRNECSGNGTNGIELDTGSAGTLEGNRCLGNKRYGLLLGRSCGVALRSNVFRENQLAGFYELGESQVSLFKNDLSGNGEIGRTEVQCLFRDENFSALEKLAERLRKEAAKSPFSGWQLHRLYSFIATEHAHATKSGQSDFLRTVEKWKAAYPDSMAWRVILASSYADSGWLERGSGFSNEVSEGGWRAFAQYMDQAWTILEDARRLNPTDPEYFALRTRLAFESGRGNMPKGSWKALVLGYLAKNLANEEDTTALAFEEGRKLAPMYLPLYFQRVRSLQPRWSGSTPEATVAFAAEAADKTRDLCGDILYAAVACMVCELESTEDVASDYVFDWERLERAFADIGKRCPNSYYYASYHCLLACLYGKRDAAKALFAEQGSFWAGNAWSTPKQFEDWRLWAEGKGPEPKAGELEAAIRDGALGSVEALLKNGGNVNGTALQGESYLMVAVDQRNPPMVRLLLEKGANPNSTEPDGRTPLSSAVRDTTDECFNLLLEFKADPNVKGSQGWPPLLLALTDKRPDRAITLLRYGADPNTKLEEGHSALILATSYAMDGAVTELLKRGADPNYAMLGGYTALSSAADSGFDEVVQILLEHGANPNSQATDNGMSPLMLACRNNHPSTVNLLLKNGASPNLARSNGAVALFDAAEKASSLEIVMALVEKGADINARTKGGWNAFHSAVRGNAKDVLEYLLKLNPEGIKVTSQSGKTLLHEACQKGNVGIVKLLLEKNAIDVNAIDKEGNRTALANAREAKSDEIVALLQAKGAKE